MKAWIAAALVGTTLLSACTNDTGIDSTPEAVLAAAYRAPGPRSLTLLTVVNNRTGAGGHTALLINASQQVIFDPAGSFRDAKVVERGDVVYGVTPGWVRAFKSAHAREAYHVVSQQITVTPAQAEKALQLVQANGAVPGAFCANATSGILRQIDGFGGLSQTFYPVNLMEQFASVSGVQTSKYFENDKGEVVDSIKAGNLPQ